MKRNWKESVFSFLFILYFRYLILMGGGMWILFCFHSLFERNVFGLHLVSKCWYICLDMFLQFFFIYINLKFMICITLNLWCFLNFSWLQCIKLWASKCMKVHAFSLGFNGGPAFQRRWPLKKIWKVWPIWLKAFRNKYYMFPQ